MEKIALITGSAKRIGSGIARYLHAKGLKIVIHFRRSEAEAQSLTQALNALRADSAVAFQADLNDFASYQPLIEQAASHWGRLDALINNASMFYPTPLGKITEANWDDLMASNCKAPLFLAQAAIPHLKQSKGCIINITDVNIASPRPEYAVYFAAKSALSGLTKSLAAELAPDIRVNAIAPGAILWPDNTLEEKKKAVLQKIPMQRTGEPNDIAKTAWFLIHDATYISGQTVAVDGGKT